MEEIQVITVESPIPPPQINPIDKGQSVDFAFTYWGLLTGPELEAILDPRSKKYAFQKEEAPTTKAIHFQGQMSLLKKARMSEVWNWFPTPSQVRRTRNVGASELYCQKAETRIEGPWTKGDVKREMGGRPKKEVKNYALQPAPNSKFPTGLRPVPLTWYDWQMFCMGRGGLTPGERFVEWFWGPKGCAGKTTMCHKLVVDFEANVIGNDRLGDILAFVEENRSRLYVINEPRTEVDYDRSKFPYAALELIKDGLFSKSKYEVKQVVRQWCSHVFVFTNRPPDLTKLTADRWKVVNVEEFDKTKYEHW